MEKRLTEAESRISFAEDLLETLNLTVYRQQQQIDSLQTQLRQLYRQCQQWQDGQPATGECSLRDEIPPHY